MTTTGLVSPLRRVMSFECFEPLHCDGQAHRDSSESNWTGTPDNDCQFDQSITGLDQMVFATAKTLSLDSAQNPFDMDYECHYGFDGTIQNEGIVTVQHGERYFSSIIKRDLTDILSIRTFSVDEYETEDSLDSSTTRSSFPRSVKARRLPKSPEPDYFEEAIAMFPPEFVNMPVLEDVQSDTDDDETFGAGLLDRDDFSVDSDESDDDYLNHIDDLQERIIDTFEILDTISEEDIVIADKNIEDTLNMIQSSDYSCQASSDNYVDILNRLSSFKDTNLYTTLKQDSFAEKAIVHIERLIAMIICASDASNYTVFAAAIFSYIGHYCEGSVLVSMKNYIKETIAMESQSSEESKPKWIESFRMLTSSFKSLTKLPAWKHVQRIISACIAVGLCSASDCKLSLGTMKLFSFQSKPRQENATDLLEAVFSTADYFIEAGYEAFTTGSLRPFLFDNKNVRILDEAYYNLSASMRALPTGDLQHTEYKTISELSHALENTLAGYQVLKEHCKDRIEKRDLSLRLDKLQQWKLDYVQQCAAGGLREQPYSIYLVGKPGIGKSMMTQVFIELIMKANGIAFTPEQIATVNPSDKFASTVRNDTLVVILDDFGNFNLEFETENPMKYIIEIINNVISYVPKADVGEKGKVVWRPSLVITTSNMENLLFNKLSNEPGSGFRRGIRVMPKLKERYATNGCFDKEKYIDAHGSIGPTPHAYDMTIAKWDSKIWRPVQYDAQPMENVSYQTACNCLIADSKKHFRAQKELVADYKKVGERLSICSHGLVNETCTTCFPDEEPMEVQSGEHSKFYTFFHQFELGLKTMELSELFQLRTAYENCSLLGLSDWFPDCVVNSDIFARILMIYFSRAILIRLKTLTYCFALSLFLFLFFGFRGGLSINLCVVWPYLLACATSSHIAALNEFRNRRNSLTYTFTDRRDQFLKRAFAAGLFLSGLYTAIRWFRKVREYVPQGNIAPTSMSDILARDKEANPWAGTVAEPLPSQEKSKCITSAVLLSKTYKNVVYVEYVNDAGVTQCVNGWFPSSNECFLPYHFIREQPTMYHFTRYSKGIKGASFKESFSRCEVTPHETLDLCYVRIHSTSPFANLEEYLPLDVVSSAPFHMVYRSKHEQRLFKGYAKAKMVANGFRKFKGLAYSLDAPTFKGMCHSVLISDTRAPMIIGLHIGGNTGLNTGCATPLTRSMLQQMREEYHKKHVSALQHASEGTVMETQMGVTWFQGEDIHPKSPIHYLPDECNLRFFGSTIGRSTYYSDVVQTPISEKVDEVLGNTQQFSGPKFHRWKSWYESLVHLAQPGNAPPTTVLDWAVQDYSNSLKPIFEMEGVSESIQPLSEIEIVSGIDGCRFVDAMKSSTSPGFPLTGRKDKLFVDLEPTETQACPRTFIPEVWEEYYRCEELWAKGERSMFIFKGCLKDEPTKVEKEKVRVFEAAPCVGQIGIRKYFIPIARYLSMQPLKSECAVGINAQGPEWDQMQKHITKFGKDRILAGDFPKYDLRMSAKFTSAAFKVMIDIARSLPNYSDRDIRVMESIATDVCYPMVTLNGDLMMFQGSNPSGQNMTVYINSIVNSLAHRVAFYMIIGPVCSFQEFVALITYGDDFKGSVSEEVSEFNHCSGSAALSNFDMGYTMPDKTSTPTKFMHDEDADFLKRHNRMHEVGYNVGALDKLSMIKSLKAVLRSSSISIEEQTAQNIDGYAHEAFFHGREFYDDAIPKLKQLAEEGNLVHMCRFLNLSFDDRIEAWNKKYVLKEEIENVINEVEEFEAQSGEGLLYGPNPTYGILLRNLVSLPLIDESNSLTFWLLLYTVCILFFIWASKFTSNAFFAEEQRELRQRREEREAVYYQKRRVLAELIGRYDTTMANLDMLFFETHRDAHLVAYNLANVALFARACCQFGKGDQLLLSPGDFKGPVSIHNRWNKS